MAKSSQELADLRSQRLVHADGADLHRFQYNHPRRREDPAVDAVCALCGLEEIDETPTAKKKTARWRWPHKDENAPLYGLLPARAKPACVSSSKE